MQKIWNRAEDPVSWDHVDIVEPDSAQPITGCVGADVGAKYVLVLNPIDQIEDCAVPPVQDTPRRRRTLTDTALRRPALSSPVPLRVYRDFDVVLRVTGTVLHRVRRF